jgi:hypothetical protein
MIVEKKYKKKTAEFQRSKVKGGKRPRRGRDQMMIHAHGEIMTEVTSTS